MRKTTAKLIALAVCAGIHQAADACLLHAGSRLASLTQADVDTIDAANAAQLATRSKSGGSASAAALTSTPASPGAFKMNWSGATAHSPNATINSFVSSIKTDVQDVYFDSNYIYVKSTGVPSHDVGRADGNNPAYSKDLNRTSRIPRNPTVATSNTTLGNGGVALMANGALLFDPGDAMSYNNQGVFKRVALTFEGATFDVGPGHSAPGQGGTPGNSTAGTYHYHVGPTALLSQIDANNTGQHHSPIIGFAFDGFPIYGPYGYSDPNDPNSALKRISSSYTLRSDLATNGAVRHSITEGGATLASNQWGPNVSTTYPAGSFKEDFKYVAGLGDLNDFNMRFAVTPDYPQGTWAYYMTLDAAGAFAFPYLMGPKYYGLVDTVNLGPTGGNATIPAGAIRLVAGDANFDGSVNFDDLLAIAQNYNKQGSTLWSQGDFNSDTSIDFDDLLLMAQHYSAPAAFQTDFALAQSLLPEPAMALGLLMSLGLAGRRR